MKLKSFPHFQRHLKPYLNPIAASRRQFVLEQLYEAARIKSLLEKHRDLEYSQENIPSDRMGIRLVRKVIAKLKLAHEQVEAARTLMVGKDLYNWMLDENRDVSEILGAINDWLYSAHVYENFMAAQIPPKYRTPHEREIIRQGEDNYYSPFKVYFFDQWFIFHAERVLGNIRAARGRRLTDTECNRLISKAFYAGFGETYAESRVKTVRRRLEGQQQKYDIGPLTEPPAAKRNVSK